MVFREKGHKRKSKSKRHRHKSKRRRLLPERGWIQLLTLRVINENPMHGYQLIDEMESRGLVETGRFETGSIYTILNRMEKDELLISEKKEADSGRIRRVYTVTPKGIQVLKEGLLAVKQHAKIIDELAEYYDKTFTETETSVEDASEM